MRILVQHLKSFIPLWGIIGCFLFFTACTDDNGIYPDDKDVARFNFFAATDVLFEGFDEQSQAYGYSCIYLDQYIENPVLGGQLSSTPYFYRNGSFPVIGNPPSKLLSYTSYPAGAHRLMFADWGNVVVLDTLLQATGGTYNSVYLADGLEAGYQMLLSEETREPAPDGTAGIRFIHLSPDAGAVQVQQLDPDDRLKALLPGGLVYGQTSPYLYLDDAGVKNGALRFALTDADGKTIFNTGAPFAAGTRYTIVLHGFRQNAQRKVERLQKDGTMVEKNITIPNDLRASLRRIY